MQKPKNTSTKNKQRVDVLLVEQGLAETREKAQALIMAGQVLTGDRLLDKPGIKLDAETKLRVRGEQDPYVSRSARKLLHGLDYFKISVQDSVCLDVGASTGGFTQVCLERGARKVFAFDVGTNQLHWKVRIDPRVVSREGFNIRDLKAADLPEPIDFICIDTSFISLKMVLPSLPHARQTVALIKPQHEVGKGMVGKGGIVREPELHLKVVEEIQAFAKGLGYRVLGVTESPILGTTGNKEFLIGLEQNGK